MIVRVRRGQLDYFRAKARQTKNEIYALLIGRRLSPHIIEVLHFAYPALEISTPFEVKPTEDSYLEIERAADTCGFSVVGTIHSHPGAPAYMSPGDLKTAVAEGDLASGIVEICGGRTRVSFWKSDTPVPCDIQYIA